MSEVENIENYRNLANAIIEKAAKDYRAALASGDKGRIEHVEKFFRSPTLKLFTDVDGRYLIQLLRYEFEGKKRRKITRRTRK